MECAWASGDEGSVNPLIKGGQFAAAFHGEGEEVNVGQILRGREVGKRVASQKLRSSGQNWKPGAALKLAKTLRASRVEPGPSGYGSFQEYG